MDSYPVAIIVGVVLLVGFAVLYMVSVYNNLQQVRQNIDKAFSNISVLLQQRHDELGKLIDACRGFMKHEEKVLNDVTRLRSEYDQCKTTATKLNVENQINRVMGGFWHHAEAYPELKSSENVLQLQKRISAVEGQISDRREFFNDSVNIHNVAIGRFPDMIVARMLGFDGQTYLDPPEKVKQDVKVDLS